MRIRILPYKQGSRSAKALATALGGKVLKLEGSTFVPKTDDVIINWGNSGFHPCYGPELPEIFNPPVLIEAAANKLWFFENMKDTGLTPEFWTTKEDIPNEAFPIVCRTILSGHSGAGIHIADCRDSLVDAQLFVKYEKKKEEYRVHLGKLTGGGTTVVSVQRKARRLDCEDPDWKVRNHANGFVYVRDNVVLPLTCMDAAIKCFEKTGLDFGAVDVIWNQHQEKAYVLEINTAPGLEGTTVTDYAEFFRLHT